jgi:protein-tyrosine phosphatase
MSYRHLLILMGFVLAALGLMERGWFLMGIWLGCDFVILGVAYGRGAHHVFGKRPDGTLPLWSRLVFLPFLIYTNVAWHLLLLLSRESAQNKVTENLFVGRRLFASEHADDFDNFVDLTAEFTEPRSIRCTASYRSFPILDGSAPTPEALGAAVASLRPGRTFVHCAQGHGRAALFALAVLLTSGACRSVEEGMRMLSAVRAVRLSREQRRCIQAFAVKMK